MITANQPDLRSFIPVPVDHPFSIQNLPFGIFSTQTRSSRVGVAIGDYVLDLAACEQLGLLKQLNFLGAQHVLAPDLNRLMALGRLATRELRENISLLLRAGSSPLQHAADLREQVLLPMSEVTLYLPVNIRSYTDFYSFKAHATNLGAMFRDKDNPLLPNWLHMPVAYDGRAGSVVVSGSDFHRPCGQVKPNPETPPVYRPSQALDIEVEMGLFVGASSQFGQPISIHAAPEHMFGMVLLNDWSARDIQKWEYVPLGPFLGKNFCTSISPWVVTLDALEPFRVASPIQSPEPLAYLKRQAAWGLDIQLEFALKTPAMTRAQVISSLQFKDMYWDICQQLAHHSVNGCPMHTGDLVASGTVSNDKPGCYGSLIELTAGGKTPLLLADGSQRTFLQDGDEAIIRGYCQGPGYRVGFGEVSGKVLPAVQVIENTAYKESI